MISISFYASRQFYSKTLLVTVATHGKEKVKMLKLYDGFIQYFHVALHLLFVIIRKRKFSTWKIVIGVKNVHMMISLPRDAWSGTCILAANQNYSLHEKDSLKDNQEQKCLLYDNIHEVKRSAPGFEPGTSATRKQNHAPRPSGRWQKMRLSCYIK